MPAGSLFEFTSRFLPGERQEQLLAVYALGHAITSIPFRNADDSVKWAKLKWWSEELQADPSSPNRHPVLRAIYKSGARTHLSEGILLRLVNNAVMQMDAYPDADKKLFFGRLADLGETDIILELALDDMEIPTRDLKHISLATGLFAMISEILFSHKDKVQRLPLDILAQHRISSSDLETQAPVAELVNIMKQLAEVAVEAFDSGMADVRESSGKPLPMHLQLRWAIELRRLTRISKSPGRCFAETSPYGPTDAWFAWRLCRRIRRG